MAYEEVQGIAEMAVQVRTAVDHEIEEEKKEPQAPHVQMIKRLLSRVEHDHMQSENRVRSRTGSRLQMSEEYFLSEPTTRRREAKKVGKHLVREARYLIKEAKLSLGKVRRRVRLPMVVLKRIRDSEDETANPLVNLRPRIIRFHKIHQRARDLIDLLLKHAKVPLTLR